MGKNKSKHMGKYEEWYEATMYKRQDNHVPAMYQVSFVLEIVYMTGLSLLAFHK